MGSIVNAVIYARFSSSGQREESIEGQIRECREYALRNNMRVVGEYADHALTGTNDKRPDFQRMIRDSSRGQFSIVIVWKSDRFARSRYDSAIYKARLKQNGVRVVYAKESIPEGPEGIILESVMEGYAEYYSANLSQNVKRGLYDSALKLGWLGQVTYGLRPDANGRYEQDPETAPIVKRIFDEYASGKPAKDICAGLNADGYRTIRRGPWNKNSLRGILKNQKYCGIYEYADIRVEDGIPAIISKELFEKVQKMVKQHHEKPAAKKIEGGFLLTGKLFCGHCGEMMTGDGGTGKLGTVYRYYTCANRRTKKCDKKRAPKDWIEDIIVKRLVEVMSDGDLIEKFADRFMLWQEKEKQNDELRHLEEQLKRTEKALKNMVDAIESGLMSDTIKSRIVALEAEKSDLEKNIEKQSISAPTLKRSEIVYFLRSFANGDVDDVSWRIYLVDTLLKAAYLYDDGRLLICLNFSGDDSKITLQLAEEAVTNGEPLCSDFAQSSPPKRANLNTTYVTYFLYGLFVISVSAK